MEEIKIQLTTVQLTPKQAKQFVMMQFLDSVGMFDVKAGQVVINFDEQGQIRDVAVTNHYKSQRFTYPPNNIQDV